MSGLPLVKSLKIGKRQMNETGFNKIKTCSVGRPSKPQTPGRVLLAIALAIAARQEACGGGAYLPLIGPPMLRFEPVPIHSMASSAKIFTPEMVKSNNVAAPSIKPLANPTNASTAVTGPVEANNSVKNSGPSIFMPSATDDSIVTPQMLVDFLMPTAHEPAFVPIKIGFIPPTQNVVAPSRAVYKSQ